MGAKFATIKSSWDVVQEQEATIKLLRAVLKEISETSDASTCPCVRIALRVLEQTK